MTAFTELQKFMFLAMENAKGKVAPVQAMKAYGGVDV